MTNFRRIVNWKRNKEIDKTHKYEVFKNNYNKTVYVRTQITQKRYRGLFNEQAAAARGVFTGDRRAVALDDGLLARVNVGV